MNWTFVHTRLYVIKCKFHQIKVYNVRCCVFVSIIHIRQYQIIIKLIVNDLEAMHSDINSVTTCQTSLKVNLSAQSG